MYATWKESCINRARMAKRKGVALVSRPLHSGSCEDRWFESGCGQMIFFSFIFLRHAHLTSPRAIGGLGLISTLDMDVALVGQLAMRSLLRNDSLGDQFRHALHHHITQVYGASPALLMIRKGSAFLRVRNQAFACQSLLSRVVFSLGELGLSVRPAWHQMTLEEILPLPGKHSMYPYRWPTMFDHFNRVVKMVWRLGGKCPGTADRPRAYVRIQSSLCPLFPHPHPAYATIFKIARVGPPP